MSEDIKAPDGFKEFFFGPETPVISSHLPDITNAYIEARNKRLFLDKQVEAMKENEQVLLRAIIAKMKEQELVKVGTKAGTLKLKVTEEPVPENWPEIWAYVKVNDRFDLLHKRISSEAVKEMRENGIAVPGVSWNEVSKITVSKPE